MSSSVSSSASTNRRSRGRAWGRALLLSLLGLGALAALLLALLWVLTNQADGSIVSGGERRSYLLHVPANYDPATPVPLIISIHGFAEWPAHQMRTSRWNDLADQHGFIVVYPAGTDFPRRWRTGGGTSADAMQDVTFIADLIDDLASRYNINRRRIYVNGLSNGGGMSYLLACRLADRIAAAGGVSGTYMFPQNACQPSRPVPFIAFHGTADRIVPYAGGPSESFDLPFPNVPDWIAAYAERSGCETTPSPRPARGEVSGIQYSVCRDDAEVVFYTIAGGGHAWPGGEPLPRFIVGQTSQDIDATVVMWEFFSRHTLAPSSSTP